MKISNPSELFFSKVTTILKNQAYFRNFLLINVLCLFICSCSNYSPIREDLDSKNNTIIASSESNFPKDIMQGVSPEVADYYNNLKTVIYATGALMPENKTRSLNTENTDEENPIISKLESLVIEDEDTGSTIGFYDLPIEQRSIFIDLLLAKEAEDLTSKTKIVTGLDILLDRENKITQNLLKEEGVNLKVVGQKTELRSISKQLDTKKFFRERERLINDSLHSKSTSELRGGWVIWGGNVPLITVPVEKVLNSWVGVARRGDFLLALPVFEDPHMDKNRNNEWGEWGHAGIFCRDVNYNTPYDANLTLESFPKKNGLKDGVQWRKPIDWQTYHYVMGICSVSYKWRWRWFRSGFYKVKTPVSNPGALADEAIKYEGCGYAMNWDFVTAKRQASRKRNKKFTCTSLVWYCSKRAYGINVSSWYSPLVSVTGLFTDDCTYIRKKVY